MKKEQLFLNTIAMKKQLDEGALQVELLPEIASLGIKTVEIRREYFKDVEAELEGLNSEAKRLGLKLFYSVNDEVIKDDRVNPKLSQYILELKKMNGQSIKFNVGNYTHYQGDLLEDLAPLLADNYLFTVENNQVLTHSKLENIVKFMDDVKKSGLEISFVFDVANWCWLNEEPLEAAKRLNGKTTHIHLKNYMVTDDQLVTTPLFQGELEWQTILTHLHDIQYFGLEYPTTLAELEETLKKLSQDF